MPSWDPYMPVDTVDETAANTEMMGPSSAINQIAGSPSWTSSPTKTLIGMWLLALAAYWFIGWFFRGQRS